MKEKLLSVVILFLNFMLIQGTEASNYHENYNTPIRIGRHEFFC